VAGWWLFCLLVASPGAAGADAERLAERQAMVQAIEEMVVDTQVEIDKERLDPRVMTVMGRVPRHRFVPESVEASAYRNRPLPIGHGQTISQPYIVALMTDLLQVGPDDVVLEVGTGSGYQAAVLAELVSRVYTIEIIEPLGEQARLRLQGLGYGNV
jgi:protein-L-isoaspartate(D-aspartate) O-methyltransferase